MPKPTGPTNPQLRLLAAELRKSKVEEYKALAKMLQKPRRKKTAVNLHTLEHVAEGKTNISVIVPWKLLGSGELSKPLRVFAFSFSRAAKEKIAAAGGECLPLAAILKEEPGHVVVLRDITEREE